MTLRFGKEERVKKQVKQATEWHRLRTSRADPKTLPVDPSPVTNGIEPVDLFDPEEFGIGLRDSQSKP